MIDKYLEQIHCMRVDIKNTGSADNSVEINAEQANICYPKWFSDNAGIGACLTSSQTKQKIILKIIKDGLLCIKFRGIDKRYNGKRIPVWIDYKSIKINNNEILISPLIACHDYPYHYNLPVKNEQIITLEIEQQYHHYSIGEAQETIIKLNYNDEFVIKNIDLILQELQRKTQCIYNIKGQQIKNLPKINADCFIPLGSACRPTYWLRKRNLRFCSFPFDWMMSFSLNTVLSTIKNGVDSWFEIYEENENKKGIKSRYVTDLKNKIISMHAFPINKSVKEHLPEFHKIFLRRWKRLQDVLNTSENICFICNRNDGIVYFCDFLKKITNEYPHCNCTLINIRHTEDKNIINKYIINRNITIYDLEMYDIHKNGSDKTNPKFWIGNEALWNSICDNLFLSSEKEPIDI